MNPEVLSDLACSRMSDLVEQALYLRDIGRFEDSEFLIREGAELAKMLECNEAFLVLCSPSCS